MHTILSAVRSRITILPGMLLMSLIAAILAVPPLAAQEATPEQPQPATTPEATPEAQPATTPEAAQETQPIEPATTAPEQTTASRRVFKINWDNTIKYSNAFRITGQDSKLINATATDVGATNQDDGDRAFDTGLVSNRGDILSEIDVTYGNVGIRASGAAWGDSAYLGSSADKSYDTFNATSVNYNKWTEGTRDLVLGHAELLDAFAFGKFSVGNSTLSVRGGQYALEWGESLFFGSNGIAGGMAPMDILKLVAVPSSQFKEVIRPVPQISMQYQMTPSVAVGAYYQLGWQGNRFAPVGSFYSIVDILGQGSERLVTGAPVQLGPTLYTGPLAFWHSADREPKNWGQFGAQVKLRLPQGWDFGIYGIQYHEKAGQLYMQPLGTTQTYEQLLAGKIGNFYWAYPENVKAIAISTTKSHGVVNYAAEFGAHFHQDLVSDGATDASIASYGHVAKPDANNNALYAIGTTIHGQVSWIASLGPSFVSKEASWAGEIAWNMLESIDKNPMSVTDGNSKAYAALDPNARKHALGARTTYEPTYRQVFSGIDISVPLGLSYFPMGRSSVVQSFGPNKGGDFSAGVAVSYLDAWRFGATLNGYYGKTGGFLNTTTSGYTTYNMQQDMSDRYTINFNVRRTFGLSYKSRKK